MTMTFKIDPDRNDLLISSGKLTKVTSADEVVQRIRTTLQHHWGEYFLNIPGGVPWYDLILGGKDVKMYETIIRKIVLDVPGVVSLVSFSTSFKNRHIDIYMSVEVTWSGGTTVVEVDLIDDWIDFDVKADFDSSLYWS